MGNVLIDYVLKRKHCHAISRSSSLTLAYAGNVCTCTVRVYSLFVFFLFVIIISALIFSVLRQRYRSYAFLLTEDEKEQFLLHLLSLSAGDFNCFSTAFTDTSNQWLPDIYFSESALYLFPSFFLLLSFFLFSPFVFFFPSSSFQQCLIGY